MSIATVVTEGFGSFGTVNFVPTEGFGDYDGGGTATSKTGLHPGGRYWRSVWDVRSELIERAPKKVKYTVKRLEHVEEALKLAEAEKQAILAERETQERTAAQIAVFEKNRAKIEAKIEALKAREAKLVDTFEKGRLEYEAWLAEMDDEEIIVLVLQ